ncbi:hypothetical protein EW146_g5898 [Bondarzewia mesenterica]|uniref:Phosphoglycerate mutase-like protein n=1 Tax=Bondarzewia mesenterica TaxID=1095465 RepID=A0A4S4LQ74_9AGAM|nr:hypothetical protein EW146_g5898 [Bondarzewia mesenterica]
MPSLSAGLLGVVLLARHGDRLEFFQDPLTYNPSRTLLTPLGTVQESQLGNFLQNTYIASGSPSAIVNISFPLADVDQLLVRADAAGEGEVIISSIGALIQGLYPPTSDFNITLANGSTIVGAGGGYQFIPVQSAEPDDDITLNSFTSCPNFDQHTAAFYASPQFQQRTQEAAPFLAAVAPFVDDRSTNFTNMFNIFDFINVQNTHNATYHDALPPTFVEQAYDLASFHEDGVFSDVSADGIGNVAIRTIFPSIFSSLQRVANASDPLKFAIDGISYKPFISFFNITAATVDRTGQGDFESLFGLVEYASALALEVHAPSSSGGSSEPFITVKFKNGTDSSLRTVALGRFGSNATSIPLSTFVNTLEFAAINSTAQWCAACNQQSLRGCAACIA